jgi:hypothetical protein
MERRISLNSIGATPNCERSQHIEGLPIEHCDGCADGMIVTLICYIDASCGGMDRNAFWIRGNGSVSNDTIGLAIQDIQFSAC